MTATQHNPELLRIGELLGNIKTPAILHGDRLFYGELSDKKLQDLKEFAMNVKTYADGILDAVSVIEGEREQS